VISAPGWRALILSQRSRDEFLASATKSAKMFLFGGIGTFVAGSALAVIGQMTATKVEPIVATPPSAMASVATTAPLPIASTPPPIPTAATAATTAKAASAKPKTAPAPKKKH